MRLIIRPLKEHWGNTIFKDFMMIYHTYYDIHPYTYMFVVSNYSDLNLGDIECLIYADNFFTKVLLNFYC